LRVGEDADEVLFGFDAEAYPPGGRYQAEPFGSESSFAPTFLR
jgi:hypothetical protein